MYALMFKNKSYGFLNRGGLPVDGTVDIIISVMYVKKSLKYRSERGIPLASNLKVFKFIC